MALDNLLRRDADAEIIMKFIERKIYKGSTEISVCQTEAPDPRAVMAMDLMRNLAMVACVPDGEDSSGRQKLRLMSEVEVVNRANEISRLAWNKFRTNGWILDLPLPKSGEGEA